MSHRKRENRGRQSNRHRQPPQTGPAIFASYLDPAVANPNPSFLEYAGGNPTRLTSYDLQGSYFTEHDQNIPVPPGKVSLVAHSRNNSAQTMQTHFTSGPQTLEMVPNDQIDIWYDPVVFGNANTKTSQQQLAQTLYTDSPQNKDGTGWRQNTKHRAIGSWVTGNVDGSGRNNRIQQNQAKFPFYLLTSCGINLMGTSKADEKQFLNPNGSLKKEKNFKEAYKLQFKRWLHQLDQVDKPPIRVAILPQVGGKLYLGKVKDKDRARELINEALAEAVEESQFNHIKEVVYAIPDDGGHKNNKNYRSANNTFQNYQGNTRLTVANIDVLEIAATLGDRGIGCGVVNPGSDRTIGGGYKKWQLTPQNIKDIRTKDKYREPYKRRLPKLLSGSSPLEETLANSTDMIYRQSVDKNPNLSKHVVARAYPSHLQTASRKGKEIVDDDYDDEREEENIDQALPPSNTRAHGNKLQKQLAPDRNNNENPQGVNNDGLLGAEIGVDEEDAGIALPEPQQPQRGPRVNTDPNFRAWFEATYPDRAANPIEQKNINGTPTLVATLKIYKEVDKDTKQEKETSRCELHKTGDHTLSLKGVKHGDRKEMAEKLVEGYIATYVGTDASTIDDIHEDNRIPTVMTINTKSDLLFKEIKEAAEARGLTVQRTQATTAQVRQAQAGNNRQQPPARGNPPPVEEEEEEEQQQRRNGPGTDPI